MEIFIDQSGRLEFTKVDTVIAFSAKGHLSKSILIKAKEKRKLQEYFRKICKENIFIYKSFAVLIFLLIRTDLPKINSINIDLEYQGKNNIINNYLLTLIRKHGKFFNTSQIRFKEVGHIDCHWCAIETFRKNRKPDIKVKFKDLVEFI